MRFPRAPEPHKGFRQFKVAAPGTIRGDLAMDLGRNLVHGSDSPESAKREIEMWFKPEENTHAKARDWICED